MPNPKRQIKDLTVTFISLVESPATGKGLLLRSKDGQGEPRTFAIVKADDEQMRAYGIVYAPGEVDSHGDTTDADVIRRAATKFMRDYRQHNVDVEHSFESEAAFVAETWITRTGDPLFSEEPEGAWAVGIQVNDADLWKRLKKGELTGISLAGWGRAEELDPGKAPESYVTKEEAPGLFRQWWDKLTKGDSVTPDEVRKLIQEELRKGQAVEPPPDAAPATPPAPTPEPPPALNQADFEKRVQAEVEAQLAKALRKGAEESGSSAVSPSFL